MSNKIEKFLNENFGEVLVLYDGNKCWLHANSVLKILEYAESGWSNKVKRLNQHGVTKYKIIDSLGRSQENNFIDFNNLHYLISTNRTWTLKKKKDFYKWLTSEEYDEYISKTYEETEFINKLEESLKAINITGGVKQYNVLNYKIDYYIPSLNIAIEYDENNHSGYKYEAHEGRQKEIENELGCYFIRVTDENSDEYNLGLVLNEIIKFTLLKDKIKKYLDDNYSCFSKKTKLNMTKELLHNEEFIQDIINNR